MESQASVPSDGGEIFVARSEGEPTLFSGCYLDVPEILVSRAVGAEFLGQVISKRLGLDTRRMGQTALYLPMC